MVNLCSADCGRGSPCGLTESPFVVGLALLAQITVIGALISGDHLVNARVLNVGHIFGPGLVGKWFCAGHPLHGNCGDVGFNVAHMVGNHRIFLVIQGYAGRQRAVDGGVFVKVAPGVIGGVDKVRGNGKFDFAVHVGGAFLHGVLHPSERSCFHPGPAWPGSTASHRLQFRS